MLAQSTKNAFGNRGDDTGWQPVDKPGTNRPAERGVGLNGPYARYCKRVLDVAGVLMIGLLLAPFMLSVALLVRLQGPQVIFGHERVGRGGKTFRCFKFRSMVPDAERRLEEYLARNDAARDEWEQNHKLDNDPRITRIGRFIRKTSLDELPQLWNVLRGEMSLVGPRPVTRAEMVRYGDAAAAYYATRPGITGLWQVSGRNDISYEERVRLDCDYVSALSLSRDMSILLRTVKVVFAPTGK